jgi:hypothetical protein
LVKTLTAETFVKAFYTGRTCPCLMLCVDEEGSLIETVVKLLAGKESSHTGLICELMASFFAQDLDLLVPEPFLVEVEADFYKGIFDQELSERFRTSVGLNFGSKFLEPGYATWPQERTIPGSLIQDAAEIFAFDLMIQNPDRRRDKPNLLRKGDELVIFDHEMAFSFFYSLVPEEYPWEGKGINYIRDHVFYDGLRRREVSFERLQGALEAINERRLAMYAEAVPEEWRNKSRDTVERIEEYLITARNNSKNLFQKIREVLV